MTPTTPETQERMNEMRRLRGDTNRQYRFARRAMFKNRDNPMVIRHAGDIMDRAREIGQATGLKTAGGIQSFEQLRDDAVRSLQDEATMADKLDALTRMVEQNFSTALGALPVPGVTDVDDEKDDEEDGAVAAAPAAPYVYTPNLRRRSLFDTLKPSTI